MRTTLATEPISHEGAETTSVSVDGRSPTSAAASPPLLDRPQTPSLPSSTTEASAFVKPPCGRKNWVLRGRDGRISCILPKAGVYRAGALTLTAVAEMILVIVCAAPDPRFAPAIGLVLLSTAIVTATLWLTVAVEPGVILPARIRDLDASDTGGMNVPLAKSAAVVVTRGAMGPTVHAASIVVGAPAPSEVRADLSPPPPPVFSPRAEFGDVPDASNADGNHTDTERESESVATGDALVDSTDGFSERASSPATSRTPATSASHGSTQHSTSASGTGTGAPASDKTFSRSTPVDDSSPRTIQSDSGIKLPSLPALPIVRNKPRQDVSSESPPSQIAATRGHPNTSSSSSGGGDGATGGKETATITAVQLEVCGRCKVIRPFRASHCAQCDWCVEEFDHHCSVLGCCIGRRNFGFFAIVLCATVTHALLLAGICAAIIISSTLATRTRSSSPMLAETNASATISAEYLVLQAYGLVDPGIVDLVSGASDGGGSEGSDSRIAPVTGPPAMPDWSSPAPDADGASSTAAAASDEPSLQAASRWRVPCAAVACTVAVIALIAVAPLWFATLKHACIGTTTKDHKGWRRLARVTRQPPSLLRCCDRVFRPVPNSRLDVVR